MGLNSIFGIIMIHLLQCNNFNM